MCQTDRGAHTRRRANQEPAVSLKTIADTIETTYKYQGCLVEREEKVILPLFFLPPVNFMLLSEIALGEERKI